MSTINASRIPFTTPPARRAVLVEQVKALYSEYAERMIGMNKEKNAEIEQEKTKGRIRPQKSRQL